MRIIETIDSALIAELCGRHDDFFWLDVSGPTPEQVSELGAALGLHPLAVEDSIRFGQRPKLDTYADTALLVMHGGTESHPEDENPRPLEEIHCYISGDYIVTLHREPFPPLEKLKALVQRMTTVKSEQYYVYKVVDAIADSYFPVLADIDDEIDDLENKIVARAGKRQLEEIFRLKRVLLQLRKAVVPMRDVFARQSDAIADLAGLEADSHDYFRDVYDHLIRIADELDSYHEMVASCTDLYLSMVANRQGEISTQLTVIASIFLPLSFLTGFFGMNFDWEGSHLLTGRLTFVTLGLGTMVAASVAMWWWFRHNGWTRSNA
jgi:magnesium transporter